ncbi:MAG TPA: TlpA disulfide reductase family protein [Bryobacteraceae bacterium]|nr:TlpA disulfide reductase family protein [Bryobacteraceae bacterium]
MAARGQHKLLEAGARAPEFRLPLLSGGETTLAEILAGGPALLAFFKISCPVCQMTFPFLERIHAAGAVRIFGISQNDAGDTQEFNQEFGVTFPTLLDGEEQGFPASNDYGISSVPAMFLVAPDGHIATVVEGWRKKEMEHLAAPAIPALFRADEYVPEWKAG